MSTPKKKHLIELMIEAGVKWPDGAEYAAQDKHSLKVNFYRNGKPDLQSGYHEWMASDCYFMDDDGVELDSLCRKWHQTIVTREQYEKALLERHPVHFPTRPPETFMCRCAAAPLSLTIEQLTADYHAKAAEANRLQSVADEALKAADDALLALEKAGELIGLVISIDTNPKPVEQPIEPVQQEITDWRDLRVGDVVEYVHGTVDTYEGRQGEVCEIDEEDSVNRIRVKFSKNQSYWCSEWRFIRRP